MKKLVLLMSIAILSGCGAIEKVKEYWPRAHDPVMFEYLVKTKISIEEVNCESPDWSKAKEASNILSNYSEWRGDPQRKNIKGLYDHTVKMSNGGSKTFCELGKKTAIQRINAAKSAWEGR